VALRLAHEASRSYGFLLFHSRVVRSFNAIVAPTVDRAIEPSTEQEFQDMGVEAFQEDASSVPPSVTSWRFHSDRELAQHRTHGNRRGARNADDGFPAECLFRAFWQLHLFIDEVQFGRALRQYGDQAHPSQFVLPSAVADHIEARHHGWVPRI
jgi:hypothetical protein